ncbi:hypothetical protein [Cupriavidus necator]
MYQQVYNAIKKILDTKKDANEKMELRLYNGVASSTSTITLNPDASIDVNFYFSDQPILTKGAIKIQPDGNAELVGGSTFMGHGNPTEAEKLQIIINSNSAVLFNNIDKINIPLSSQGPSGVTFSPPQPLSAQNNNLTQRANVILYKGRGHGELAVKFVDAHGNPDTVACSTFISEMGPNYSAFARTYPQQPGIIFHDAYTGGGGELAVKFPDQATRDKFYERLNLTTGHAMRYSGHQSATLHVNPVLHPTNAESRPSMTTSYTPSPLQTVVRQGPSR